MSSLTFIVKNMLYDVGFKCFWTEWWIITKKQAVQSFWCVELIVPIYMMCVGEASGEPDPPLGI